MSTAMSTRQKYLASLASRRLDDDEGDGSSSGTDDDSDSVNSFEDLLQVTPPRSGVPAAAAITSTVAAPPIPVTARHPRRLSLSQGNRNQGVLTEVSDAKSAPMVGTKSEPAITVTPIIPSSPPRRATSQRKLSHRVGSHSSHDASNSTENIKSENSMNAGNMKKKLPRRFALGGSLESSYASSNDDDSSSILASAIKPISRQSVQKFQRRPRNSVGGDSVKSADNILCLKKDVNNDDAPPSLESTTAKPSSRVRELDRLKRLSIGRITGSKTASVASLAMSGRIGMEANNSISDGSEITLEVSPITSRQKDLDRVKSLTRISPKDTFKTSLNQTSERWRDKWDSLSSIDVHMTKESEHLTSANPFNGENKTTCKGGVPCHDSNTEKEEGKAMFYGRYFKQRFDLVDDSSEEDDEEATTSPLSRRDCGSTDSLTAKVHLRISHQRQPSPSVARENGVDRSVVPSETQTKAITPLVSKPSLPGEKIIVHEKNSPSSKCEVIGEKQNVGEVKNDYLSLTRAGRRRNRSLSRCPGIVAPSSTLRRSTSSFNVVPPSKAPSMPRTNINRQTSLTPPKYSALSSHMETTNKIKSMATTPNIMRRSVDTIDFSNTPSPLTRSSHNQPRSPKLTENPLQRFSLQEQQKNRSLSPMPRSAARAGAKGTQDGRELSPTRQTILRVSKPSRLASLSIARLSTTVMPIQRIARSYISKLAVEKRMKHIVVIQSLIRRWKCKRYYKSAQTVALRCQGLYHGRAARDRLDFLHYCSTRIQAAFRGFSGRLNLFLFDLFSLHLHLTYLSLSIHFQAFRLSLTALERSSSCKVYFA